MVNTTMTQGSNDRPLAATRGGVSRAAVHVRAFARTLAVASLLGGTLLSASTVAHATPVLDYYKQLSQDERRSIEYDLIWIGGTDAVTNGVVGRQSIAAIKEFERRIGTRADGILRPRERRALARQAERAREDAGYEVVIDEATGAAVGVPFAYVDEPVATRLGARYEAADGAVAVETYRAARGPDLRQIYQRQIARPGREVTYEVFRGEWFVVAGREGERRFYTRARTDGDEVRAYTIDYDPSLKSELEPTIVAMSNDFEAFASDPAYRDRTPRRVEAVAERNVPEGCPAEITVRAGDTLRRIARRCGVTVRELRLANDRIRPRELQAGQTLFIPDAAPRTAERIRVRPPAPRVEREVVPVYQPTAVYLPRRPREDGRVRVSATGFPPETEVEVGFLRGNGRYVGGARRGDGRARRA